MQQAISYRDNAGFVIVKEDLVKRYVHVSYAPAYDHFMGSGLYQRLLHEGLLIPHEEVLPGENEAADFYKVLEPEKIGFINLPYEWSASQWKEVVLAFLQINMICLDYGMILKDATPFNFTFYKGRCIFFDTLSFAFYEEGKPWVAYRQFCESMLGPLSLIYFNDPFWSRMFQSNINGWPLPFVSANLPVRTWLNLPVLLHIHWHAGFQKEKSSAVKNTGLTKEKLSILWGMMKKSINKWNFQNKQKSWVNYYDMDIQSNQYLQSKTQIITQWLDTVQPNKVIDLGANNGMFSIIASHYATDVIALESDHACIEKLRLDIKRLAIQNIETVMADITQPAPGLGWKNAERIPLLKRLKGDLVLALALIHHLCISSNIPMNFVAELFSQVTTKYLLIEFVPRSDAKVEQMLSNREDIFGNYTETVFEHCFGVYFRLKERMECSSSDRKLYLWEKK